MISLLNKNIADIDMSAKSEIDAIIVKHHDYLVDTDKLYSIQQFATLSNVIGINFDELVYTNHENITQLYDDLVIADTALMNMLLNSYSDATLIDICKSLHTLAQKQNLLHSNLVQDIKNAMQPIDHSNLIDTNIICAHNYIAFGAFDKFVTIYLQQPEQDIPLNYHIAIRPIGRKHSHINDMQSTKGFITGNYIYTYVIPFIQSNTFINLVSKWQHDVIANHQQQQQYQNYYNIIINYLLSSNVTQLQANKQIGNIMCSINWHIEYDNYLLTETYQLVGSNKRKKFKHWLTGSTLSNAIATMLFNLGYININDIVYGTYDSVSA
jgi:hypothetical protein